VRATALAETLNGASTVWNTVHRMQRDGLVEVGAGKEISLSEAGQHAAESIKRRHLLTESLLVASQARLGRCPRGSAQDQHAITRGRERIVAPFGNP
jgi:Mn-dependent DtxR family transcriptional regulator